MDERWSLEEAKNDYLKTHPKKHKEKKNCCDCEFSEMDYEGNTYCYVKDKFVTFFTGYCAKRCKYYQK